MADAQRTTSRSIVVFLMGLDLWTFFLPIVTADAPVRGRSQWAPLDLLVARADQWRPAPHIHLVLYQIASIYALMVFAILALALPSPHIPVCFARPNPLQRIDAAVEIFFSEGEGEELTS